MITLRGLGRVKFRSFHNGASNRYIVNYDQSLNTCFKTVDCPKDVCYPLSYVQQISILGFDFPIN